MARRYFTFFALLTSFSLIAATASAQCSCSDCGSGVEPAIGVDYNTIGACGSGNCGTCSDCYGTMNNRDCSALSQCRYLSLFGGWNGLESFSQANAGPNSLDVDRGSFDDGGIFGAAIGSQVHPNVRFELEGTYRDNDAEAWIVEDFANNIITSSTVTPATGSLEAGTIMMNFLVDFPSRQPNCWNFYAGAGIGAIFANGSIVAGPTTYDINDSAFAFQAIGGLSKAINTKVDFFTEYRFLNSEKIAVQDLTTPAALGDFNYDNNSVVFGLRLRR